MKKDKEKEKVYRILPRQKTFAEVFKSNLGNVSIACDKIGISRQCYYDWIKDNPKFKSMIEEIQESLIDYSESKLMLNIQAGKEASIFFHLKTKGKERGYIESVDNRFSDDKGNTIKTLNIGYATNPEKD